MSKYIDADKLVAKIKELNLVTKTYEEQVAFNNALAMVVEIITSLQQRQQNAYEDAMLEVKEYVDKLYDNASIGLNEYDSGLYNGIAETCMKLRGFIKARTSRERPEVDLEKEIGAWRHEHFNGERDGHYSGEYLTRASQSDLAHHFYELGKNGK